MIIQSADIIVLTTDTAFLRAVFVTNAGSIIPALIMLVGLPVTTSLPQPFLSRVKSSANPALSRIVLYGDNIAPNKTSSPLLFGFIF